LDLAFLAVHHYLEDLFVLFDQEDRAHPEDPLGLLGLLALYLQLFLEPRPVPVHHLDRQDLVDLAVLEDLA
jgi:hypothetical protein